jgi:hypothetical protein
MLELSRVDMRSYPQGPHKIPHTPCLKSTRIATGYPLARSPAIVAATGAYEDTHPPIFWGGVLGFAELRLVNLRRSPELLTAFKQGLAGGTSTGSRLHAN